MADAREENLLTLTADIVSAHAANNTVSVGDLPVLIARVHEALSGLGAPAPAPEPDQEPAVSVRASVKPDYIVCLEDGKKMKMLKRHLATDHAMTPAEYRAKWKLPSDYPLVAPNYAAKRKELAVKIGLGRKPGQTRAKTASKAATKTAAAPAAAVPAQTPAKTKAAPAKAAAKPRSAPAKTPKPKAAPATPES